MENHNFSISSDKLKKIQSIMLKEARHNNAFFDKIVEEGYFYFNADEYYGGEDGEVAYDLSTEKVAKEIDSVINDIHEVSEISISPLIFYTPIELIEKCISVDILPDVNGWNLGIFEVKSYESEMFLFEKICPVFKGKYKWSKSKQVPKEVGNLSTLLDCYDFGIIVHLYMNGSNPVIEQIPHYNNYSDDVTEKITKVILKHFGEGIKEVYFVTEEKKPFSKVIARKNDDGELTLSIY